MQLSFHNFWYSSKDWIEQYLGLEGYFAHAIVGTVLFILAALLLRNFKRPMLVSWLLVLTIQVLNETMDARDWLYWTGSINWVELSLDTLATLIVPTALCGILRIGTTGVPRFRERWVMRPKAEQA